MLTPRARPTHPGAMERHGQVSREELNTGADGQHGPDEDYERELDCPYTPGEYAALECGPAMARPEVSVILGHAAE